LDFKVQWQGIELAEQAADVTPGGVGIGHDPQAIRPAAQGRGGKQAPQLGGGNGLVPEPQATVGSEVQADYPLGQRALQPHLGQQQQAQGKSA
jgi:hypothetical protein